MQLTKLNYTAEVPQPNERSEVHGTAHAVDKKASLFAEQLLSKAN